MRVGAVRQVRLIGDRQPMYVPWGYEDYRWYMPGINLTNGAPPAKPAEPDRSGESGETQESDGGER